MDLVDIGPVLLELAGEDGVAVLEGGLGDIALLPQLALVVVLHLVQDQVFRLPDVDLRLVELPFVLEWLHLHLHLPRVAQILTIYLLQLSYSASEEARLLLVRPLELIKTLLELPAHLQQLVHPLLAVVHQDFYLLHGVSEVPAQRGDASLLFRNECILLRKGCLQFADLPFKPGDAALQAIDLPVQDILLLDKSFNLLCLAVHLLLEFPAVDGEQVLQLAVLIDPPAIVGFELLLLQGDGPVVVGPESLEGRLELPFCLVFYDLCVVQLLVDIVLDLLHLCPMPTHQLPFLNLELSRLLTQRFLMQPLQLTQLSHVPHSALDQLRLQTFNSPSQFVDLRCQTHFLLRIDYFYHSNFFPKHKTVLYASCLKIVDPTMKLRYSYSKGLLFFLIEAKAILQLLISLQVEGLLELKLPELVLDGEQSQSTLFLQLGDLQVVGLLELDLHLLVLAVPLLVVVLLHRLLVLLRTHHLPRLQLQLVLDLLPLHHRPNQLATQRRLQLSQLPCQ